MIALSSVLTALLVQAPQAPTVIISAADLARAPRLTIVPKPTWRVGGEGAGPYNFTRLVGGTFTRDGGAAVLEFKPPQVRVFGGDGKHRFTFGRLGQGPGEFSQVQRLVPHVGDSLVVSQVGRISVFDRLGNHARTFATVNAGAGLTIVYRMLANGTMLATGQPMPSVERAKLAMEQPEGIRRDSTHIVVLSSRADSVALDLGKRLLGESIIVRHNGGVSTAVSKFSAGLLLEATDSLILVSHSATATIEILSARTGRTLRNIELSMPRRALDADNRAAFLRTSRMSEPVLKAMPYPDRMPFFDRVHWAHDGIVRVRLFMAPLDSTAQWLSLTTSGRLLSIIDLPAKTRALDFDRDRVLLVERDADDLEYLALYKLIPAKR